MSRELDAVQSMNRAGAAAIKADAEELVEIQRQARGRLLGDWSPRLPAPKRPEPVDESPTTPSTNRKAGNPVFAKGAGRGGRMAAEPLRAKVQALAAVRRYGWARTLARLAGVSVAVLKTAAQGLPVREDIAEKLAGVTLAQVEAEVAQVRKGGK